MASVRAVGTATSTGLELAAGLATLEDVLAWALPRGYELLEVLVQDEYTHDVIVRAGASFVVFDTT